MNFSKILNNRYTVKEFDATKKVSNDDFEQIKSLLRLSPSSINLPIKAPTLVLQGKHDEVVRFNVAEYYKNHIPNATLVVIENAAHSPQLEVPEEVANDIKKFIKL